MEKIEVTQEKNNRKQEFPSKVLLLIVAFLVGASVMYFYGKYNPTVVT